MTEIEISDGVFVSYNNLHVKLRTMRNCRECVVYLDPTATEALAKFIELRKLVSEVVNDVHQEKRAAREDRSAEPTPSEKQ
jgi:hypothetical protein